MKISHRSKGLSALICAEWVMNYYLAWFGDCYSAPRDVRLDKPQLWRRFETAFGLRGYLNPHTGFKMAGAQPKAGIDFYRVVLTTWGCNKGLVLKVEA